MAQVISIILYKSYQNFEVFKSAYKRNSKNIYQLDARISIPLLYGSCLPLRIGCYLAPFSKYAILEYFNRKKTRQINITES